MWIGATRCCRDNSIMNKRYMIELSHVISVARFWAHAVCLMISVGQSNASGVDMMTWVHLIRPQNFREEVANERRLVLLLCMPHNDAFHEQIQIIEELARLYANELKVMLTEESSLEAFKKDLSIVGTPTILFLKQGREIFRILGLADLDMLRRFVGKALGNHPGGSPSENIGG